MSELSLPLLYRHILRAARRFPSIKRDAIVQEIKAEFAANKVLHSPYEAVTSAHKPAKIAACKEDAAFTSDK